jgi:spore germination cell wall hydrolase CwlJ-like protein
MTFDADDVHSLALCAWKEARGEGAVGCQAVMHVIVNRTGFPGFASTIHDVIYGKNQFTSMSVPSDPEFNLQPHPDDEVFRECTDYAQAFADNNAGEDITKNAHYYANLHNCTSGWFHDHILLDSYNHPITAQIGHHTFFK